jgi:hypothetical protein
MVFLKVFLWFFLFVIAFSCWVVVLEHGISGFSRGVMLELEGLRNLLERG